MKKIFVPVLVFLTAFFFFPLVSAAPETVIYDFTYIDNHRYNLTTGSYTADSLYACTNRLPLQDPNITVLDNYFHHVLFWGHNNYYIGYYNHTGATTYETAGFLGYTGGMSFNAPAGAESFAFIVNTDGTSGVIPSLSPLTYADAFASPLYGNYTDSVLPSTLTASYQNAGSYSLIPNGRFSMGDLSSELPLLWTAGSGTYLTWCTSAIDRYRLFAEADGVGGFGEVHTTTFATASATHHYYLQSDVYIVDAGAGSQDELTFSVYSVEKAYQVSAFDTWETFYTEINTVTHGTSTFSVGFTLATDVTQPYVLDNILLYDMTAIFGSGNEPSAADFHDDYLPYYSFGDSYYTISNRADPSVLSYADLTTAMSNQFAFPTYTLTRVLPTNLITNGDFSVDSNSDGLADNWTVINSAIPTIVNGFQRATVNVLSQNLSINQTVSALTNGNQFYVIASWNKSADMTGGQYLEMTGATTQTILVNTNANWDTTFSHLFTSSSNNTVIRFYSYLSTQFPIGVWMEIDNVYMYNISSLKTAGLFGGMSDAQIKTVLDDYAVNGLTASNIGYFFDGPAAWDSLSIADKNTILSYYGTGYTGGTVIDFTYSYFDDIMYSSQLGSDFTSVVIFLKESTDKQYWHGVDNSVIDTKLYMGETPTDFTTLDYTDLDKWGIASWRGPLTAGQQAYYDQLYHDALDTVERWEWYNDVGITADNYASILSTYNILLAYYTPGISFANFQTIDPNYTRDVTPYVPDPVDDSINDWFDDLGLGTFPKILTAIVLMILVAVIFGFLHVGRIIIIVLEGIMFILFAILGWFPVWLVIVFAALIFVLFIKIVFIGGGGGE